METHGPVDTLVLMLGTNDCKTLYNASPYVISMGIERMIRQVKQYDSHIRIILLSPILLGEEVWKEEYDPEFNQKSVLTAKGLKEAYSKVAEKYGCEFLAASDYAAPSKVDMEHLTIEGHGALAEVISHKIQESA